MQTVRPLHAPPATAEPEPIEPGSRNEARRYVSYKNLLATGRAVRRQKTWVIYSTAGDHPQKLRLRCATGHDAKRLAMAMHADLRQARTDEGYNAILAKILAAIKEAWPDQVKDVHVHTCDRGNSGQGCPPNPETGVTLCGFDWREHEQTLECKCGVLADESFDAGGEYRFIVHRQYVKKEIFT